jgi:hypothetical protein
MKRTWSNLDNTSSGKRVRCDGVPPACGSVGDVACDGAGGATAAAGGDGGGGSGDEPAPGAPGEWLWSVFPPTLAVLAPACDSIECECRGGVGVTRVCGCAWRVAWSAERPAPQPSLSTSTTLGMPAAAAAAPAVTLSDLMFTSPSRPPRGLSPVSEGSPDGSSGERSACLSGVFSRVSPRQRCWPSCFPALLPRRFPAVLLCRGCGTSVLLVAVGRRRAPWACVCRATARASVW